MEDDLRTAHHRPAHRLRIAPSLVADRDPERDALDGKDTALSPRCIPVFLREIELHFVLKPHKRCVAIDDERGDTRSFVDDPLGAKDDRDLRAANGIGDRFPGAIQKYCVGRRHPRVGHAIPRDVALREADDVDLRHRRVIDCANRARHRVFGRRGEGKVGQRDAKNGHVPSI